MKPDFAVRIIFLMFPEVSDRIQDRAIIERNRGCRILDLNSRRLSLRQNINVFATFEKEYLVAVKGDPLIYSLPGLIAITPLRTNCLSFCVRYNRFDFFTHNGK